VLDDYIAASLDLEKLLEIEENADIQLEYEHLKKFIADQRVGEKKVFKSFFRVIILYNTYSKLTIMFSKITTI